MSNRVVCSKGCCFECDECSKKTGMSLLCESCYHRRYICSLGHRNKPPLGVMPKDIWQKKKNQERIRELTRALHDYKKYGAHAKQEWRDELVDLILEEYDN